MPDDKEGASGRTPRRISGNRATCQVHVQLRLGAVAGGSAKSDGFDVEVLGVANTQFRD